MAVTAKFYVSVNGGANQDGGVEVPSAATIKFVPHSIVGWLRARWEIYDYPEGWAVPAGWTRDPITGTVYSLEIDPAMIALPTNALLWGVWMLRVLVNEQIDDDQNRLPDLLDDGTAISMLSPAGYRDIGARENGHFATPQTRVKGWLRNYQRNLRLVEQLLAVGNGVTITNATGGSLIDLPSKSGGANASVIISTGAGDRSLFSIADPAQSRAILLIVRGSGSVTAVNNSGGVTPANRILTYSGANVVLQNGSSAWFVYDNNSACWVLVGTPVVTDFGTAILKAGGAELGSGTKPTSGLLRVPAATASIVQAAGVSAGTEFTILGSSSNNDSVLGGLGAANGATKIQAPAAQSIILQDAGTNRLALTGTTIQVGLPRIGAGTVYASEGRAGQPMADANQTLAAAAYSRKQVRLSGTLTAARTATFPHPTSEDRSYSKHVENACVGANVVISTGTGTVVVMHPGQSLSLDFTPSGVKQAEANGNPDIFGFRLTGLSGNPLPTGDVTTSTLYLTPWTSGAIALFDGVSWVRRVSGEVSIALASLTSGMNYDVFAHWDGSAVILTHSVWNTALARSIALASQDGVPVRFGDNTRRYVGTFRTTAANQTRDAAAQRFVWNFYNRLPRGMHATEGSSSWQRNTTAILQANGSSSNKLEFVQGMPGHVSAQIKSMFSTNVAGNALVVGVGLDTATAFSPGSISMSDFLYANAQTGFASFVAGATYEQDVSEGYRTLNWNEKAAAASAVTVYGTAVSGPLSHIRGIITA